MIFFILAGGYGKRAEPLSLFKPKPLFPLDGRPLLHILLDELRVLAGGEEFRGLINLHHLPGQVESCVREWPEFKPDMDIHFLFERELSGSRVLKEAPRFMRANDVLLVINGDTFMKIPYAAMIAAMTPAENEPAVDGVLVARKNQNPGYKQLLTDGDGFFRGRKEYTAHDVLPPGAWMYTGTALFKPHVLCHFDHTSFFDSLESAQPQFRIKVLEYHGPWLDIGSPRSYLTSNFIFKAMQRDGKNSGSNSLSPGVVISPRSVVEHSIIWENTGIEAGVVIKNCIVTGGWVLSQGVHENQIITRNEIFTLDPCSKNNNP